MKTNYLIAIVCSCVTGIAIGIGIGDQLGQAKHHHSQRQQASLSDEPEETIDEVASSAEPSSPIESSFDAAALSQLQEQFNKVLAQQQDMQNHQSELNRDLNALQFRLDTHSESFRPMRSERETKTLIPTTPPPQSLSPLLPPLR